MALLLLVLWLTFFWGALIIGCDAAAERERRRALELDPNDPRYNW